MAMEIFNPNTILPHGDDHPNDNLAYEASAEITPGMILDMHLDSTQLKWRPHNSGSSMPSFDVALSRSHSNKTISDAYAIGDTVRVHTLARGDIFYGLISSGDNIVYGDLLMSNGDGYLTEAVGPNITASSGVAVYQSLSNPGSVTADTRIRARVIA